jgi:hypothetical protein
MIKATLLMLVIFANCITGCFPSENGEDFYHEKNQKNKYFLVDRKNVDYLTPATVLSLRDVNTTDLSKIPEYLETLCVDYSWMNSSRFIYIFESSNYSAMFDSFGIENVKKKKPIEKYIASYNPDEKSITFLPLIKEKREKVYLSKDWCKNAP